MHEGETEPGENWTHNCKGSSYNVPEHRGATAHFWRNNDSAGAVGVKNTTYGRKDSDAHT